MKWNVLVFHKEKHNFDALIGFGTTLYNVECKRINYIPYEKHKIPERNI